MAYHIHWVNNVQSLTIDGNDNLAILVDNKAGQTLGRSLYLTTKESAAIVRQGPAELKIFPHKSFRRGIAGYCLLKNN